MKTYVDDLLARLRVEMPDCDSNLLRLYALLALIQGSYTALADVHDAWSLWAVGIDRDHPAIVPFNELTPEVQELDRPYMEAIRRIAEHV